MPHYKHHTLASGDHSDVLVAPGEPDHGDVLVWNARPTVDTAVAQRVSDAFPTLTDINLDEDFPMTDNGYWGPGRVVATSSGTVTGSEASRAFAFFVSG